MKAEEIHLLGLRGLRALAEFDPAEYLRSTDLSIGDLENKINLLLGDADNSECRESYDELMNAKKISKTHAELTLFLQQIYASTTGKARYRSRQWNRQQVQQTYAQTGGDYSVANAWHRQERGAGDADELVRLSGMRMLRELRGYSYTFHRHFGDGEIDSVLEPSSPELPPVLIEAELVLRSPAQIEQATSRLHRAMSLGGSRAVGIIVTGNLAPGVGEKCLDERTFLLFFDLRENEFGGSGLNALLKKLSEPYLPKERMEDNEE